MDPNQSSDSRRETGKNEYTSFPTTNSVQNLDESRSGQFMNQSNVFIPNNMESKSQPRSIRQAQKEYPEEFRTSIGMNQGEILNVLLRNSESTGRMRSPRDTTQNPQTSSFESTKDGLNYQENGSSESAQKRYITNSPQGAQTDPAYAAKIQNNTQYQKIMQQQFLKNKQYMPRIYEQDLHPSLNVPHMYPPHIQIPAQHYYMQKPMQDPNIEGHSHYQGDPMRPRAQFMGNPYSQKIEQEIQPRPIDNSLSPMMNMNPQAQANWGRDQHPQYNIGGQIPRILVNEYREPLQMDQVTKIPRIPKNAWQYQYRIFQQKYNIRLGLPTIMGVPIDLYTLFYTVMYLGGFRRIIYLDHWIQIAMKIGFAKVENIGEVVRDIYKQYLLDFEYYFWRLMEANMISRPQESYTQEGTPHTAMEKDKSDILRPKSTLQNMDNSEAVHQMMLDNANRRRIMMQQDYPNSYLAQTAYNQRQLNPLNTQNSVPAQNAQKKQRDQIEEFQNQEQLYYKSPSQRDDLVHKTDQNLQPGGFEQAAQHLPNTSPTAQQRFQPQIYNSRPINGQGPKAAQLNQPDNYEPARTIKKSQPQKQARSKKSPHLKDSLPPEHEKNACSTAQEPNTKAASPNVLVFYPRVYTLDTYGGIDINSIEKIPAVPRLNMSYYGNNIDVERLIMSIKSGLDSEIGYALDFLTALSTEENGFCLSQYTELLDLILDVSDGKYTNKNTDIMQDKFLDDYLDMDNVDKGDSHSHNDVMTASTVVYGPNIYKTHKSEKKTTLGNNKPLLMRFIVPSYCTLVECELQRINELQDHRVDDYYQDIKKNLESRIHLADIILTNFSFVQSDQQHLGANKRFHRLLMRFLSYGIIIDNENSVNRSNPPKADTVIGQKLKWGAEENKERSEYQKCASNRDQDLNEKNGAQVKFPNPNEDDHLKEEWLQQQKDEKLESDMDSILEELSFDSTVSSKVCSITRSKSFVQSLPNLDLIIERRVNGITILSNIGCYVCLGNEMKANIVWCIILDFLCIKKCVHTYAALEALAKLTFVYENALYLSKFEHVRLIIEKILSMLPSEPNFSLRMVHYPRHMKPQKIDSFRNNSPCTEMGTPQGLHNHPCDNETPQSQEHPEPKNYTVFQPTLNPLTQEDMASWEMASITLLNLVKTDGNEFKKELLKIPDIHNILKILINSPVVLQFHGIRLSLVPSANVLCIRALHILKELIKDPVTGQSFSFIEDDLLKILWHVTYSPEYQSLPEPTVMNNNDTENANSSAKTIQFLVTECLGLLK